MKIYSSDFSSTNDIYCVYLLPIAAVTDDHVATPEQHTFIISVLRHWQGWFLLEAPQKQIIYFFFQLLEAVHIPWLVAAHHYFYCHITSLTLLNTANY